MGTLFLPNFLLLVAALPFWNLLRSRTWAQSAMHGVNAAVVGILAAALQDPVFTSAIHNRADFALAAVLFVALVMWRTPPWIIVLLGAAAGAAITLAGQG
ncbi:chromate transporter [Paracoccus niistensis]|uniref:Chromate transporter n=1 Tax=Paracoccus niistensis TaxID=632935 RepID=A0ABV6I6A6_9RHOB